MPRSPGRLALAVGLPLLVADVITKRLVVSQVRPGAVHEVLGDFLRITLVYNRDAAMGLSLGPWSRWGFATIATLGSLYLLHLLRQTPPGDRLRAIGIGMVIAGAWGNLIDRLRWHRGVVDLIDTGIGDHRFWIFNVADMGVCIGAVLVAIAFSRSAERPPAGEAV